MNTPAALLRLNSQFVPPSWIATLPAEEESLVKADGSIDFNGQPMKTMGPSPFTAGQRVIVVSQMPRILAYDAEALTAQRRSAAKAAEERREAEAAELRYEQGQARAENNGFRVPAKWRPEIKVVLSGLTENSSLNGASRRTVMHIRLLEPIHDGKFTRRAGDYLCTTAAGSNGAWLELAEAWDEQEANYGLRITCKACRHIVARWQG